MTNSFGASLPPSRIGAFVQFSQHGGFVFVRIEDIVCFHASYRDPEIAMGTMGTNVRVMGGLQIWTDHSPEDIAIFLKGVQDEV